MGQMPLWFRVAETGLVPGHTAEVSTVALQSPNRTGTVRAAGPGDTGEENLLEIVRELGKALGMLSTEQGLEICAQPRLDIVPLAWNPSVREVQSGGLKFKTIISRKVSRKPAWAT